MPLSEYHDAYSNYSDQEDQSYELQSCRQTMGAFTVIKLMLLDKHFYSIDMIMYSSVVLWGYLFLVGGSKDASWQ